MDKVTYVWSGEDTREGRHFVENNARTYTDISRTVDCGVMSLYNMKLLR
jgi:hypothetical protein